MEEKQERKERKKIDDNVIYIGDKPFANYVWALLTQISDDKQKEVHVIARGRFISRAVDVVEMAKTRFSSQGNAIIVKGIEIGSEKFDKKEEDGRERTINVSVINITVTKSK